MPENQDDDGGYEFTISAGWLVRQAPNRCDGRASIRRPRSERYDRKGRQKRIAAIAPVVAWPDLDCRRSALRCLAPDSRANAKAVADGHKLAQDVAVGHGHVVRHVMGHHGVPVAAQVGRHERPLPRGALPP